MHSIERYGIVALLFLVVTVVAVLMWDGGKAKKKESLAATRPAAAAKSAALEADRPVAGEDAAARRLSLLAESQPGPLLRQSRPRREAAAGAENTLPSPAGETPPEAEESAPAPLQNHATPASERADTGREEPARDPIVGRAPAAVTHPYAVRSGDTLSEIAQRELGSSRRWPEIVVANPGLDPARLRAGKTIQIPGAASAAGAAPKAAAGKAAASKANPEASPRTWKVAKGENLWKIAERALGDGKRWTEIAALNPRVNPERLVLGQVLSLPGASSAAKKSGGSTARSENQRAPLVASSQADRPAPRGGKVR